MRSLKLDEFYVEVYLDVEHMISAIESELERKTRTMIAALDLNLPKINDEDLAVRIRKIRDYGADCLKEENYNKRKEIIRNAKIEFDELPLPPLI